ncbi:S1 family peptidase [Streptomyces sp. NPDC127068]|uniref:S1 family peptidase n=1 Tax=Streptomyces sp. NPDC127068 TaxID=3347127 RepID=UPI00366531E7
MKISRKPGGAVVVAATIGGLLTAGSLVGGPVAAATGPSAPTYQPEMVRALADSLGVPERAAVERLDREAEQQRRLAELRGDGVRTRGAFFTDDGTLTVNVADRKAAAAVTEAGLHGRVAEHGERELGEIKARLDAHAQRRAPRGVSAWEVDLAADRVTVRVHDARTPSARAFLKEAGRHGGAVRVVEDRAELAPQAVVAPGSRMTFGGFVCSVGYGAKDGQGRQVLVTAGHCIEGLPVLAHNGARFAQATHTRFAAGRRSVDMGIAVVDPDDSIGVDVTTHGRAGSIAVRGATRAPSGAALCKSGQTTGWTCGRVGSYHVSVTYSDPGGGPNTVVTGLASSSVCTQGGDSGGAYLSGNQAQGMTSGGPVGQRCGGQVNARGRSYFQPLDDALRHYGLTLNTK